MFLSGNHIPFPFSSGEYVVPKYSKSRAVLLFVHATFGTDVYPNADYHNTTLGDCGNPNIPAIGRYIDRIG